MLIRKLPVRAVVESLAAAHSIPTEAAPVPFRSQRANGVCGSEVAESLAVRRLLGTIASSQELGRMVERVPDGLCSGSQVLCCKMTS